jgi:hypothetical protein
MFWMGIDCHRLRPIQHLWLRQPEGSTGLPIASSRTARCGSSPQPGERRLTHCYTSTRRSWTAISSTLASRSHYRYVIPSHARHWKSRRPTVWSAASSGVTTALGEAVCASRQPAPPIHRSSSRGAFASKAPMLPVSLCSILYVLPSLADVTFIS